MTVLKWVWVLALTAIAVFAALILYRKYRGTSSPLANANASGSSAEALAGVGYSRNERKVGNAISTVPGMGEKVRWDLIS